MALLLPRFYFGNLGNAGTRERGRPSFFPLSLIHSRQIGAERMTEEEKKERKRAYKKAYRERNRERVTSAHRLYNDRVRHAHIEGHEPTGDRKPHAHIESVTNKGFLYLAYDRQTGAMKIGSTLCVPETRLDQYGREKVVFLLVSPIMDNVRTAEETAHQLLRGNVRKVSTRDKRKTSTHPLAEWFQLDGGFTIFDVLGVYNSVMEASLPSR